MWSKPSARRGFWKSRHEPGDVFRYTRSFPEAMGISVRESGSRVLSKLKFWKAEQKIKRGVNVGVFRIHVYVVWGFLFFPLSGFIFKLLNGTHLSSRGLNWWSMSFNFRIRKCYLFEMRRALVTTTTQSKTTAYIHPKWNAKRKKKGGKLEVESWQVGKLKVDSFEFHGNSNRNDRCLPFFFVGGFASRPSRSKHLRDLTKKTSKQICLGSVDKIDFFLPRSHLSEFLRQKRLSSLEAGQFLLRHMLRSLRKFPDSIRPSSKSYDFFLKKSGATETCQTFQLQHDVFLVQNETRHTFVFNKKSIPPFSDCHQFFPHIFNIFQDILE